MEKDEIHQWEIHIRTGYIDPAILWIQVRKHGIGRRVSQILCNINRCPGTHSQISEYIRFVVLQQVLDKQAAAISPPGTVPVFSSCKIRGNTGDPRHPLHAERCCIQISGILCPVFVLQKNLTAFPAAVFYIDSYNLALFKIKSEVL